jgi:hypothetical protein
VFVLAMPTGSAAHRLDEYLQAARVSLERDRITLEVDLTPGANIASAIITLVDRDADTAISPDEARAYGQRVLSELVLELDGSSVPMTLTRVETPTVADLRDGVGTIQLQAAGSITTAAARHRELYFRNTHRPDLSVYLVNALLPDDDAVRVVAQRRDPRQQSVRIEYEVGRQWPARMLWLLFGGVGLSVLIVFRRARLGGTRMAVC